MRLGDVRDGTEGITAERDSFAKGERNVGAVVAPGGRG